MHNPHVYQERRTGSLPVRSERSNWVVLPPLWRVIDNVSARTGEQRALQRQRGCVPSVLCHIPVNTTMHLSPHVPRKGNSNTMQWKPENPINYDGVKGRPVEAGRRGLHEKM